MNVIFENSSPQRCFRVRKVNYEIFLIPSSDFRTLPPLALKVALYYIVERFEYNICINNFSVGKCLSHSTQYKVNIKDLPRETKYGRLFQDQNVVALATMVTRFMVVGLA